MTGSARSVDDYVKDLPKPARDMVTGLRRLVRSVAPQLVEEIKWGAPAYLHPDGVIMFTISAHKAHANIVFTPSTREAFTAELAGFDTGKGSVKLPYHEELPTELLGKMIRYRIREYEDDGVKWM